MYSGVFPPKRRFWGSGDGSGKDGCSHKVALPLLKQSFVCGFLYSFMHRIFFFAKHLKLFHLHNLGFVFSYYKFLGL